MSYLTNNVLYRSSTPVEVSSKRIFDVVCCLVALPILALITLAVAICMQLVSPGPVFFRQERVGYQGRRFRIYKFRTMTVAADTGVHQQYVSQLMGSNAPMVKLDARGDSRLIFGGWLIRACGLDELPQLINVLRGDMSLVGPRPCLPAEYEQYSPQQRRRFGATPGLTGLWQVSGKNRTTFNEMIRLDIEYAENRNFWMDLAIIAKTIPALVQQLMDTRRSRKQAALSSRMTEIPFPISSRMTEIPFPMERLADKAK
jgi:lipopolysaccharide/colanic/teichoic acid biosynthesis glycosyltransferase